VGLDHPLLLSIRNNLTEAYLHDGRTAEAIKLNEAMLEAALRVVRLDEAWGNPEKAAEWPRKRLTRLRPNLSCPPTSSLHGEPRAPHGQGGDP
jgi:hypothetical protein